VWSGKVVVGGDEWRRREGGRCILLSNTETRKMVLQQVELAWMMLEVVTACPAGDNG
jgi:hypothetical protein